MILAGIDIGTNALRLFIADISSSNITELYSDRKITRLGKDLDRTGMLTPEASEHTLSVLSEFSKHIRAFRAEAIWAVGTSALRNARNAGEFIQEAIRRSGIAISVISGDDEARFMVLGVERALSPVLGDRTFRDGPAIVLDVGGGSTELVSAGAGTTAVVASLPLGAVYLTERFLRSDPPGADEMQVVREQVRTVLNTHCRGFRPEERTICAGTAGTITTLASMDLGLAQYDHARINGHRLGNRSIDRMVNLLGSSTQTERRLIPGLDAGREDIIYAGAVIVQEVMQRFGFRELLVSDWGLREGVVLDLYERTTTRRTRASS